MAGPFFIAGTGRCGTSQLLQVLGEHPDVHGLHWETRFLIDPGGFEDLARALTDAYTPYHADDALRRAAWLLNERLTGLTAEEFRGWGLAEEIGVAAYRAATDRLWQQLTWYEFDVTVPPLSYRYGRWQYAPGEARSLRRVVARYFPDRGQLITIVREFAVGLFEMAAHRAGKATWCEKTPLNLLSIPFLRELFPEATIAVIMRHPCQVAASHLDQPWAPSVPDDVLHWLQPMYQRWLSQRDSLLDQPWYVEVKAETLAEDWPASRRELFSRLGLPDAETTSSFTADGLSDRISQLDPGTRSQLVTGLQWASQRLGYQPDPWP
jgi:hypothetical protein